MDQNRLAEMSSRGARSHWLLVPILAFIVLRTAIAGPTQPLLSPQQTSALEIVAAQRPCAAATYVFVRDLGLADHGILQLEGLPTLEAVQTLINAINPGTGDVVSLRSPYSSATFFVEIHWSVMRLDAKSFLLTTRAEIVDVDGRPLSPPHQIEPITTVLASADSIRLLQDSRPNDS